MRMRKKIMKQMQLAIVKRRESRNRGNTTR